MSAIPRGGATRVGAAVTILFASAAVLLASTNHLLAGLLGVVAAILVGMSLLEGTRSWLATGALLLVAASGLSILEAGTTPTGLFGLALSFVVWDCGEFAIGLGEHVGREGPTARHELRNAGVAVGVAVVAVAAAWIAISGVAIELPLISVVLFAVGGLFSLGWLWSR